MRSRFSAGEAQSRRKEGMTLADLLYTEETAEEIQNF